MLPKRCVLGAASGTVREKEEKRREGRRREERHTTLLLGFLRPDSDFKQGFNS